MRDIMKSIGIIAEYNPFHNGHLYHIEKIKEKYPDYSIILVMTGNFTERGDVSVIDKWKRTEIALKHGIDLVIDIRYHMYFFMSRQLQFISHVMPSRSRIQGRVSQR